MTAIDSGLFARLVDIRRDLHRHPELSWQETRTAGVVCEFLASLGIPYRDGIAGTGVIADIPGVSNDQLVALRADLDALPIIEETGLSFCSQTAGVMHACGHDGHTTMLLGAAALLSSGPAPPVGVRLIFQPAEETGEGALAMVKSGALERVAMIFGAHVDRHFPVGSVVVTDGPVNASSDSFKISISGRGGHGARPHETVDAVVVGSLLVMAIQTIVSREINPAHPSVVSVGQFLAGTAPNVIAGQAELTGTIRAQDADVRVHLQNSIRRIATSVAQLHEAAISIEFHEGTPPLINSPEWVEVAREAAARAVGAENVLSMDTANMGGEDFSHYLDHVPGCYVRVGSTAPGVNAFPAHSSRFDIDEGAIGAGAAWFAEVARLAGQQVATGEHRETHANLNED
ncbi:MAG: amidohydrolase [Planctomycetales bacterium]|nr:amidohydrolase [Planctomycetales bacterium]